MPIGRFLTQPIPAPRSVSFEAPALNLPAFQKPSALKTDTAKAAIAMMMFMMMSLDKSVVLARFRAYSK
jgi:hypothetical protein